ncbi:MAG: spore cortex biosynthesis protein YabQ [Clostridia bacterium]|nr:spore cortex biosynthesis protein YabQ [Clostridia bacterium]
MFVSHNQIYYFSECLFIGVLLGVFYEFFYFFKSFFKGKILKQIIDFLFFLVAFSVCFKSSEIFCFPNFRAYLFCGILIGFSIYALSFHKTLAKVFELLYNKTVSFIRRKNHDRKQKAKAGIRGDGNVGNNSIFVGNNFSLPTRKHRRKNKGEKRPYRRKR